MRSPPGCCIPPAQKAVPSRLTLQDLDTAPGQSGSPIWESTSQGYYVRATHNAGGPYHRTIVKDYYNWILQNRK